MGKKPYKPPKKGVTELCHFLCSCLKGNYHLGLVVCLSQEPGTAWQSCFSCDLGDAIAMIERPIHKGKVEPITKALEDAKQVAAKTQKALDATPRTGSTKSEFWPLRKAQAMS